MYAFSVHNPLLILTIFLFISLQSTILFASQSCITDPALIPSGYSANLQQGSLNLYYIRRNNATGPTVILVHGWPQNWASWYKVIPLLPDNFDVIAVNLRGVSPSDAATDGYDKKTMAKDILQLMDLLSIQNAHFVGHDIGGMVSYAFARQYPDRIRTFTIIDVPLPGTIFFDQISADPRAWHFGFNAAKEFPEALTTGREGFFYGEFMREIAGAPDGLTPAEIRTSVEAYSTPSTAKAGFGWYRAFATDAEDNKMFAEQGKLKVPVLALNAGRLSPLPYVLQMMNMLAEDVRGQPLDSRGSSEGIGRTFD